MQSDWRNAIELRAKRTVGDMPVGAGIEPYDGAYEPAVELVRLTAQMREAQAAIDCALLGWGASIPRDVRGVLLRASELLRNPDRNMWPRAVDGTASNE